MKDKEPEQPKWVPGTCWANPPGSHPDTVTVGKTTPDSREVKEIKYKDWEGRCKACYP